MEVRFTPEQLAVPRMAESAKILKNCVHYGFCTAACPTYILLGDENDSPRGRIELIRQMLESDGPPSAATVGHLDKCLGCLACMGTCGAKVDYRRLIDHARVHIEDNYRRPLPDRLFRELVALLAGRPQLFRKALQIGVFGTPFRQILPARLRNLVDLANSAKKTFRPYGDQSSPNKTSTTYPAQGKRKARVALLTGCIQSALGGHISAATIRVLTRHGCEVVVRREAQCCGAFTAHMGKESSARRDASACVAAWAEESEARGLDAVLTDASGCGSMLKDLGHFFSHEGSQAQAAERVAALSLDITEFLYKIGVNASCIPPGYRIAYHDPCSLQHGQHVTHPPRALLKQLGFSVQGISEGHFCCGSAGAYNMLEPELSIRLGERKAKNIAETRAQAVATGNLGCINQIGRFAGIPIVHTIELIDWATGGPRPPVLDDIGAPADTPQAESAQQATASQPSDVPQPSDSGAFW